MLISDLVPLAMDGLSVALACNACSPWNSGAWDSTFEIRGSRLKKDSRLEIRGQQRNDRRDPGANHEKNAPIIYPGVYHPTVANLLPRFCPLSPLSSCGNRARAAPISYRQSLLQISKRSDCCIRHPQHSIQCQRQSRHRFIFCHSRLTARFGSLVQGRCTPDPVSTRPPLYRCRSLKSRLWLLLLTQLS